MAKRQTKPVPKTTKVKINNFLTTHKWKVIAVVAVTAAIGTYAIVQSNAAESNCRSRTYRQGARGECVKAIQYAVGGRIDGVFGPATKQAVMNFQRGKGKVDGVVGPQTWSNICAKIYPRKNVQKNYYVRIVGCR